MRGAISTRTDLPDPDLLIRTGAEHRISNFLTLAAGLYRAVFLSELPLARLQQVATLVDALVEYQQRERRFGRTERAGPEATREARRRFWVSTGSIGTQTLDVVAMRFRDRLEVAAPRRRWQRRPAAASR